MRLAVARDEGLDEATVADADGPGATLTDSQRAAFALADAEMSQPSALPPEQVAQLHAHFRPDELLELALDVMKWNHQKVAVALGTDDEVRPGELADLAFDAEGHAIF